MCSTQRENIWGISTKASSITIYPEVGKADASVKVKDVALSVMSAANVVSIKNFAVVTSPVG